MNRKGWSIRTGIAKGRKPPDWYYECPSLTEAESFYLTAFFDLDSERSMPMGQVGRIPWAAIERYARLCGLNDVVRDVFHRLIRALDLAYRDYYTTPSSSEDNGNAIQKARSKRLGK